MGRERGHSLAAANLCGGVKRRVEDINYYEESENDGNVGSAKKRTRWSD